MDIKAEFEVGKDVRLALQALTNEEAAKLIAETGRKLIAREGLFQKHFDAGQGKWKPGTPAYEEYKQRKYGSQEKFVKTGKAKAALKTEGGQMQMRANGKSRKLQIWMRRMVDGKNVLSIAQRGRFKGLNTKQGFISKNRVHAGDARGVKGASRASDNSREITVVMDGDASIAERVVQEEFAITMEKRANG